MGRGSSSALGRSRPVQSQEEQQDGQAEQELDEVGEHGDHGQHLGGEEDLLDEVAARDEHARGLEQRGAEPGPGQDAAEEEQEVGLDASPSAARAACSVKTRP